MAEGDVTEGQGLAAGDFSSWLIEVRGAISGESGADVPCQGCTACCTSSQFIHIGPDEVDTLAHIPAELLFPAPRLPRGHVVLGYDERGHCPMLVDNACSIYQHRPQTCRSYDCRVFPAAGLGLHGDSTVGIAQRARQWQFSYPTPADHHEHDAVRAAAAFLGGQRGQLPADVVPSNAAQLAVLAIEVHDIFLGSGGEEPDPDVLRREVMQRIGARHQA